LADHPGVPYAGQRQSWMNTGSSKTFAARSVRGSARPTMR
jgi:hypothetical protein